MVWVELHSGGGRGGGQQKRSHEILALCLRKLIIKGYRLWVNANKFNGNKIDSNFTPILSIQRRK